MIDQDKALAECQAKVSVVLSHRAAWGMLGAGDEPDIEIFVFTGMSPLSRAKGVYVALYLDGQLVSLHNRGHREATLQPGGDEAEYQAGWDAP